MPTPPRPTANRPQPPQRGQAPRAGAPPPRGIVRAPQPQGRTFVYRQRTPEAVMEQRNRQTTRWDIGMTGVTMFRPRMGENMIRILPPSWTELQIDKSSKPIEHYAYQVWMHKYVGTGTGTYPCLREMRGEHCPMCEEWQALRRAGDQENASQMAVKEQWIFYLLDRKSDVRDKPVVWSISKMQDDEIVDAARGFSGEVIFPDHPDEGYDLRFTKSIRNPALPKTTRYSGFQFAPDPSPIHDNPRVVEEILQWLEAHPLPDQIKFYDADYMEAQLMGTAAAADESLDDGYQDGGQVDGDGHADDPRYAETQYADADGQGDQGDQGDGYDPEATAADGQYAEEAVAEADAEAGEAAQAVEEEVTEEEPVVETRPTRRPIASAAPRGGNSAPARPAPRAAAPTPRRAAPQAAPRSNTPQRPARR